MSTRIHRRLTIRTRAAVAGIVVALLGAVLTAPAASAAPAWSALGTGLNARAYATVVDSRGNVYAGGEFTTAGGSSANRIAKWNGTAWQALGTGITGAAGNTWVLALAVDANDDLYVGGQFTAAGGVATNNIAKWDGSTWSGVGTGGGTNGTVRALTFDSVGTLYAGGEFTTVDGGGIPADYIASFDGTSWNSVLFGVSGTAASVNAIATHGMTVYVGGHFDHVMGSIISASNIASFVPFSGWAALGSGVDDTVDAVAVDASGDVYAGGHFSNTGATPVSHIAKWGSTTWSALGSGLDDTVMDLAIDSNGNLYAGGYFGASGATSVPLLGKWDGTAWSALGGGVTSGMWVDAVSASGPNVIAGGQFGTVGGISVNGIARYATVPTATTVSPTSGPVAGGTTITVSGSDFIAGATGVTVGGTACTSVTVASGGASLTCVTPAHAAGAVDVVVTTAGGSATVSSGFTFLAAPTVTSVSPTSGSASGGTSITITGTDFSGATAVTVGGTACTSFNVDSATQITCTTPAHAIGAATIAVTGPGGAGSLANAFTFIAAPTVSSISPTSGGTAGGTSTTITGTNLIGTTSVTVGGTACASFTVNSATSISCTTPAHAAGTVDVVVTNPMGNDTLANGFTFVPGLPAITAISPASGPVAGGTSVTLTGTEFVGLTVTIGGSACTSVVVSSTTSATCTTPAHAAGAVDVVVTNSTGSATLTRGFVYVDPVVVDDVVEHPAPVRLGVLALGGQCPAEWNGPSWEQWPNDGLGGQTCTLVIEWSSALNTYEQEPASALARARLWERATRALLTHS